MAIEISLKKGTVNPTSASGLTLAEPVFNVTNNTLWIGKGSTASPIWVGAGVCGASGGIAAGLTYQIPTLGAVKDYITAVSSNFLGTTASYVASFNGLTGAVQGVSSWNGSTGAVTFTNYVASFNGNTGAVTGASLGANTFIGLNTFSAGISAAGATFGATVTIAGGTAWHSLNDGAGSGLDADLVRGVAGQRFAENLQTGILYGGLISVNAGNSAWIDISAGAGIISSPGASLSAMPVPTVSTVTWTAKTGVTLSGITSYDETWLSISSSGTVTEHSVAWTDSQFDSEIPIGAVYHVDRAYVNLVKNSPHVAYGQAAQMDPFVRAFGALKLSGHEISANGANLSVNRTSGRAYAIGRNYQTDPNQPNIVTDTNALPASVVWRFYRNGGTGFTTVINSVIDPNNYDNGSGTLASTVKWTIQRIFFLPNQANTLGVYYGRAEYTTLTDAELALLTESFTESESTATQGVFLGYLIVKGNCTDLSDITKAKFIQGGLFRNVSGGGGAGLAVTSIDDLSDVTITSAANDNLLRYSGGQWINSAISTLPLVASFNGLTGAVTGVTVGGANAFTALNSFGAGISAAGGVTLSGSFSGTTGAFSNLLTASGGVLTDSVVPLVGLGNGGILYLNTAETTGGGGTRTYIGDVNQDNNGTYIIVDDVAGEMSISGTAIHFYGAVDTNSTATISGAATIGPGLGVINSASTALTTTTANQIITTLDKATYRSAEFFIQASTAGGAYEALKIMMLHDGTNTYNTQYGVIRSGGSLGTYTTTISTTAVRLRVTPTTVNTTYKVMITALPV